MARRLFCQNSLNGLIHTAFYFAILDWLTWWSSYAVLWGVRLKIPHPHITLWPSNKIECPCPSEECFWSVDIDHANLKCPRSRHFLDLVSLFRFMEVRKKKIRIIFIAFSTYQLKHSPCLMLYLTCPMAAETTRDEVQSKLLPHNGRLRRCSSQFHEAKLRNEFHFQLQFHPPMTDSSYP